MKSFVLKICLLLTLAASANAALAASQTQPLLRGSYQKIIAAHAGQPFIVALWSVSCTHCGADLEIFERLAKQYATFNLVLISTDTPEQEAVIVSTLNKYNLGQPEPTQKRAGKVASWVFADSYTERLRFEIDAQWYGELPRTYFFDAKGKATGISGVLDAQKIKQWLNVTH
jgi:thiol-disulfide isomerase/thioredoxin